MRFFAIPSFLDVLERAVQYLPKRKCEWRQDENPDLGVWESGCGNTWFLEEATPKENDMNFCPFCGKPLNQKLLKELFVEEE